MSKTKSLNCLEKRSLLNRSPVPVEELVAWGRQYQQAGHVYDAVDFYERAGVTDELASLLPLAISDGDVFLFRRLCRLLGKEGTASEWLELARRARELGKDTFAEAAFREAGGDPDNQGSAADG